MADISWGAITLNNAGSISTFQAGEAISEGDCFYKSSNKMYQCDNNVDDDHADIFGVALTAAAGDGSYFVGARTGAELLDSATPFTQGSPYFVSANAGRIAPEADLASAARITLVGWGKTTSVLLLAFDWTGISKP